MMQARLLLPWALSILILPSCGGAEAECVVDCENLTNVESATCEVDSCVIEECARRGFQEFDDCDGDWTNGCEAAVVESPDAVNADLNDCGTCGNTCPSEGLPETVEAICEYGECAMRCKDGYADGDERLSNGCEELSFTLDPPDQPGCGRPVPTVGCDTEGTSCTFSYHGIDCQRVLLCSSEGYTSPAWQVVANDCPDQ